MLKVRSTSTHVRRATLLLTMVTIAGVVGQPGASTKAQSMSLTPPTPSAHGPAITFTVNSTTDDPDAAIGNGICATASGACTLRAAITEANRHGGPDVIAFNIPGTGVQTIRPATPFEDLHGTVTIDGYAQPGATPNTDARASNAVIKVEIAGPGEFSTEVRRGLRIFAPNSVVRGLAVYGFFHNVTLAGTTAKENVIAGNFLGTNAAGTYIGPQFTTASIGASVLRLSAGASFNRIGGTSPADRNVISGSTQHGLTTYDPGTNHNVIINNLIGLAPNGTTALPNRRQGVDINAGSSFNKIGGTGPNEANVISGNGWAGVEISHLATTGIATTGNEIVGNYIGTDVTGTQAPSFSQNADVGIQLEDEVEGNIISNNIIGNNRRGGVNVVSPGSKGTIIADNWIGVTPGGTPIPNGGFGVQAALGATKTRIGPNNRIAYHPVGIRIADDASDFNTITRNSIFANTTLGIDLGPDGVNQNDQHPHTGPNQRLNFPVLQQATPTLVSGTACSGCIIEVFITDGTGKTHGEGKTFVGTTTAATDGTFSLTMTGVQHNQRLTATATDAEGNTSEFSANILVINPQFVRQLYLPIVQR